jgi:hypothetical protein
LYTKVNAAEAKLDARHRPDHVHAGHRPGLQQLYQVERGWRSMKTGLDLRPVYHRLEERIRAHVILCWLALLLVRVVETTTGATWHQQRQHLDELHIGTFTAATGTYRQRTELTKPQRDILAKLNLTPPKKIIELAPTPT